MPSMRKECEAMLKKAEISVLFGLSLATLLVARLHADILVTK